MRRDAQAVVLLLLGGSVLRISLTDAYLRYVKEWIRPWLIVSGVLLVVLALVAAWNDGLLRRLPHDDESAHPPDVHPPDVHPPDPHLSASHHGDCAGPARHHGPAVAWLLLLPVLAIFLIGPPALGAYAVSRQTSTVAEPADAEFPPLPDGDPVSITMTDYVTRSLWDKPENLHGRAFRITGFVVPKDGGGWYVARIRIMCCAADGRAVNVEVRDAAPPPTNTWVEVTGRFVAPLSPGSDAGSAVLAADQVTEIPEPASPYE